MPSEAGTKKVISIGIALLLLFIIANTLILPYFEDTHEYGFGDEPCMAETNCTTGTTTGLNNPYCSGRGILGTCDLCNNTDGGGIAGSKDGYIAFLDTCHSLDNTTSPDSQCYLCTDWGFKITVQGMLLLVLVLGLIFFAIVFMPKVKFR